MTLTVKGPLAEHVTGQKLFAMALAPDRFVIDLMRAHWHIGPAENNFLSHISEGRVHRPGFQPSGERWKLYKMPYTNDRRIHT